MAFECCSVDMNPVYYGPSERLISYSEEQYMLLHLCERLSSQCNCTNEPPNAVDETRREATLLMNLLRSSSSSSSSSSTSPSKAENKNPSVTMDRSPSDQSFLSDHSSSSRSKRKGFSFTCPSLSLVEDTLSYTRTSLYGKDRNVTAEKSLQGEASFHLPAHLMGRPLKVDDRDAIRLSADAMARNVLQSIQKTLDHRIQTWIYTLSKKLVHYEHEMLASGATIDDLKPLLQLPEATLLVALQQLQQQRGVATEGAHTSFEILSQRIDSLEVEANDRHQRLPSSSSSSSKIVNNHNVSRDSPTDRNSSQDSIQSGSTITTTSSGLDSYSYIVAHQLRFVCTVHLQTLHGYTEIEMIIPGSIAGDFVSSELDPTADLVSVTIDIDTKILISLIDKACRTVLRSSVEKLITQPESLSKVSNDEAVINMTDTTHSQVVTTKQATVHKEDISLTSPPMNTTVIQTDSVFVTPGPMCPDHSFYPNGATPNNVLLPMPDDLNDHNNNNDPTNKKPRRISPQPISEYYNTSSNMSATGSDDGISIVPLNQFDMDATTTTSRPNKLKRRTSSVSCTCCCLDSNMNCDKNHQYCNVSSSSLSSSSLDDYNNHIITSNSTSTTKHRLVPLISPQYNSNNNSKKMCHVPTNGPSLPMLVEVACREILGTTIGTNE